MVLLPYRVKKVCFKTLVDEVQELEALSKDPGAVVHGKRYHHTLLHHTHSISYFHRHPDLLDTHTPPSPFSATLPPLHTHTHTLYLRISSVSLVVFK